MYDAAHVKARVLLMTAREDLLDFGLEICARSGIEPIVVSDAGAAVGQWRSAEAIVIGADVLPAVVEQQPVRRDGVFVVAADEIPWEEAARLGVEDVFDPHGASEIAIERFQACVEGRDEACVIVVSGATGGAGASTFATALARIGAGRGHRVLLVDADPNGGGLDIVMGAEHERGSRWNDLDVSDESFSGSALRALIPEVDGVALLSWGREVSQRGSIRRLVSVVQAGRRSHDLVVIDLVRGDAEALEALLAVAVLTVMLVPEEIRSLAAARQTIAPLQEHTTVAVVTWPRNGGTDAQTVESLLGAPVVAHMRREKRLSQLADSGGDVGSVRSVRRAATAVLDLVGLKGVS